MVSDNQSHPVVAQRPHEPLSLLIAGEINIQDRVDPASAFAGVMPALRTADVLFGHLEGPLSTPSTDLTAPDIPHKDGWRHSAPEMVEGLVAAGFDAVSCASNVAYPPCAAIGSRAVLNATGIAACGVGKNLAEARRPAIVERNGVRFGFLSYTSVFWPSGHAASAATPGVATIRATTAYQPGRRALEMPGAPPIVTTAADPAELQAMCDDVRSLREMVDIVVLSCHWGVSSSDQPVEYQRQIAHGAIEAGADLVLGHHPHVLQAVEFWRGRPIFYSLGNFVFDWRKMRERHLDGILLRVQIRDRAIAGLSFIPIRRNGDNLAEALDPSSADGLQIVNRLKALSHTSIGFAVERNEVVVGPTEHTAHAPLPLVAKA